MDLDIKLLNIFRVVAAEKSFSAAAERLNTSLPNISMNMSQLEARLEMRLCERGVKGFRLTEQGQKVLDASEQLYGAIETFRQEINVMSIATQREVRIGVLTELVIEGKILLPELLASIERKIPEVFFHLTFEPAAKLREKVEKGELLFAIGYFFDLAGSLQSRYLCSQRLLCYCSKDHELFTVDDIDINAEMLANFRSAGFDDLSAEEEQEVPFIRSYDSCSRTSEGILALILTGNYLGLLPEDFARNWVDHGLIRAIGCKDMSLMVDIELIFKSNRAKDPEIKALMEAVNQCHPFTKRSKGSDGKEA
jgi:LysR family transcriptional regulator, transcriptional activator for bauABCD operon